MEMETLQKRGNRKKLIIEGNKNTPNLKKRMSISTLYLPKREIKNRKQNKERKDVCWKNYENYKIKSGIY